jgi:protoheme IX farnesyltransferase
LSLGVPYAVVSISAGAWFLRLTYKLEHSIDDETLFEVVAMQVFHASITYLSIIFLAVGLISFVA